MREPWGIAGVYQRHRHELEMQAAVEAYEVWSRTAGNRMLTLYAAYTDDEPDDVIIEELIDWLSRRMPKTVEAFKERIAEEPDFRASMVLLMRGRATILHSNDPDDARENRLRLQLRHRPRS